MQTTNQIIVMARGLLGAVIGGAVGYFAFGWIYWYGFYAMILPGAALGFGFGTLAGERNRINGIISGVLATGLALFTEWSYRPFDFDDSFGYFVTHIHKLTPITLIMIAVGSALAYWSASGNTRSARHDDSSRSTEV